jgi:hypothetical protein
MQLGRSDAAGFSPGGYVCDQQSERDMTLKRTLTWSLTAPCLLAATGLLAACDARQAPLADYRSGQPNATAWRQPSGSTVAPARHIAPSKREATARPAVSNPAPDGISNAPVTPPSGAVTASTAMPGPVDDSGGDVSLVGLNMQQTRDRLGVPTEEIEQSPAKVWRYRTTQCSVDVAMYPDVHTQVFRVLNYEVKGNDGTEQGRRKCISGLRSGSLIR